MKAAVAHLEMIFDVFTEPVSDGVAGGVKVLDSLAPKWRPKVSETKVP